MSQLSPIVRAFRALSKAADDQADRLRASGSGDRLGLWLDAARVFQVAATDLEQQIARDFTDLTGKMPPSDIVAKTFVNEDGSGGRGTT